MAVQIVSNTPNTLVGCSNSLQHPYTFVGWCDFSEIVNKHILDSLMGSNLYYLEMFQIFQRRQFPLKATYITNIFQFMRSSTSLYLSDA